MEQQQIYAAPWTSTLRRVMDVNHSTSGIAEGSFY